MILIITIRDLMRLSPPPHKKKTVQSLDYVYLNSELYFNFHCNIITLIAPMMIISIFILNINKVLINIIATILYKVLKYSYRNVVSHQYLFYLLIFIYREFNRLCGCH